MRRSRNDHPANQIRCSVHVPPAMAQPNRRRRIREILFPVDFSALPRRYLEREPATASPLHDDWSSAPSSLHSPTHRYSPPLTYFTLQRSAQRQA